MSASSPMAAAPASRVDRTAIVTRLAALARPMFTLMRILTVATAGGAMACASATKRVSERGALVFQDQRLKPRRWAWT